MRIFEYNIPLKKPFKIANGAFNERNGFIIQHKNSYTEIAPLPFFSEETTETVRAWLFDNQKEIEFYLNNDESNEEWLESIKQESIRFGLSFLKVRLNIDPLMPIEVNGLVSLDQPNVMISQIEELISFGFTTIKFKVDRTVTNAVTVLDAIRKNHTSISIRLDANQAWDETEALINLSKLADYNIEYVEQPISANHLSGLKHITQKSPIPIAADESLAERHALEYILTNRAADVLILKPMILGSYNYLNSIIERAKIREQKIIITSTFESAVGRSHLIAFIQNSGLTSQNLAHGLGTGRLLADDVTNRVERIYKGKLYPENLILLNLTDNKQCIKRLL